MNRLLPILCPIFFASGACGLIYEVVWSQLFVLVMGATTFAITTVLVAFMAGLALGSYAGGRLAPRIRRPLLVYGVLEAGIGLYALVLPRLLESAIPLYVVLYKLTESSFVLLTLARFAVSGVCLLVPTTLMGATLPLLLEQVTRGDPRVGGAAAWLYGVNTAGAVVGSAAGGFALIPALGLSSTTHLAAALNVAVGLAAIVAAPWPSRVPRKAAVGADRAREEPHEVWRIARPRCGRVAMLVFGVSGCTAMLYQVAWTRVLVPHLGPHVYSFTCVLTSFLLGLALGSMGVWLWVDRWRNPIRVLGLLQGGIALGALATAISLDFFPSLVRRLAAVYGDHFSSLLAALWMAVTALLIVPTTLMGATFPVVARLVTPPGSAGGRAAGKAYAFNTVGTILGASATGFLLIPSGMLGLRECLLLGVAINAVCALLVIGYSAIGGIRRLSAWPVAVTLGTLAMVPLVPAWDRDEFSEASYLSRSGRPAYRNVKFYRDDIDATVVVTEQDGCRSLWINNKCDGSTLMTDARTQLLAAHLPALLADEPRTALVIGWGTGMTVGALTRHESVRAIDAVEISQGVLEASRLFAEYNHEAASDPRVRQIRQDGRNHLLLTDRTYDLIVSEPSNPWVAGSAYLFTHEFYELCASRLNPGGILLTWMHGYTVEPEDFRRIVGSVVSSLPFVTLWADGADFMMIGAKRPITVRLADWLRRYAAPAVRLDVERLGYTAPEQLLGLYLAGPTTLRRWTCDVPLHSDDHPTVQFTGARALLTQTDHCADIALAAFAISDDGLTGIVRPDPAEPDHYRILQRAARMREARQIRARSLEAKGRDRLFESADLAWQACRIFPDDPAICDNLHGAYEELVFDGGWQKPECVPLLEVIRANLPPVPAETVAPTR